LEFVVLPPEVNLLLQGCHSAG
jgi:hypothetical protein